MFRERVEAADEKLLAAGNFTECETIEVIKKAGFDYRKKWKFDENVYTDCRIIAFSYRAGDVTSKKIQGEIVIYETVVL